MQKLQRAERESFNSDAKYFARLPRDTTSSDSSLEASFCISTYNISSFNRAGRSSRQATRLARRAWSWTTAKWRTACGLLEWVTSRNPPSEYRTLAPAVFGGGYLPSHSDRAYSIVNIERKGIYPGYVPLCSRGNDCFASFTFSSCGSAKHSLAIWNRSA